MIAMFDTNLWKLFGCVALEHELDAAFEPPIVRARTTGGDEVLDRISVRDFICDVEIGAFQSERGVTQRIRFNVVLEVGHSTAAQDDDVDKVLSYDTIVDAIEEQLRTERINLLETLAERVAQRCLDDRRSIRVFVRIEKLDRIPGTLGVEIVRARIAPDAEVISALPSKDETPHKEISPVVMYLSNEIAHAPALTDWLDAAEQTGLPVVFCLEPVMGFEFSGNAMIQRRTGLLSIEQNAWSIAGRDQRCVVVASRTELEHAAKLKEMSVWAPSKIVLDAVKKPEVAAEKPMELALWFADEIGASNVLALGAEADLDRFETIAAPADLAAWHASV
jgi:dihydroneopterin aldolase